MTAQALIFDLSAFPGTPAASNAPAAAAGLEVERLLDQAVEHGLPCALISELPYREAEQQLRRRFGDTAHHIFSVVLTGADFQARGHKAPYSVVLNQMGVPPDDALAVTGSPRALAAARNARIGVQAGRMMEHGAEHDAGHGMHRAMPRATRRDPQRGAGASARRATRH